MFYTILEPGDKTDNI